MQKSLINQINRLFEGINYDTRFFPQNSIPNAYLVLIALKIFNGIQSDKYEEGCITATDDGNIIIEWNSKDWNIHKTDDRSIICIGIDTIPFTWWEKLILPIEKLRVPKYNICAVYNGIEGFCEDSLTIDSCINLVKLWLEKDRKFWRENV